MVEEMVLFWSGGKDSALVLHQIQSCGDYTVVALLSTFIEEEDRLSAHGVRRALLEDQVKALGYDMVTIYLPEERSNVQYEERVTGALSPFASEGIKYAGFGDIFLEDVRKYREERCLAPVGMEGVFPLWGVDTTELAERFIDLGFKAVITCVDTKMLASKFVGLEYDRRFLADLPSHVDPCGERGEFHSFVYDGPLFSRRVAWKAGEVSTKEGRFCYCDLVPEE